MAIQYQLRNVTQQNADLIQAESRRAFQTLLISSLDKIFGGLAQLPGSISEERRKDDYFNLQKTQYENSQQSKLFGEQQELIKLYQEAPELAAALVKTEHGQKLIAGMSKQDTLEKDGKVYNVSTEINLPSPLAGGFSIEPEDLPPGSDRGLAGIPAIFQDSYPVGTEVAGYPTVEGRPDYSGNGYYLNPKTGMKSVYPPPPGMQTVNVKAGAEGGSGSGRSSAGADSGSRSKAGAETYQENATYVRSPWGTLVEAGKSRQAANPLSLLADVGRKLAQEKKTAGLEATIANLETAAYSLQAQYPQAANAIRERMLALKEALPESESEAYQLGTAKLGVSAGGQLRPKDQISALKDRISVEGRLLAANLSQARTAAMLEGDQGLVDSYMGQAKGNQERIRKYGIELAELQKKFGLVEVPGDPSRAPQPDPSQGAVLPTLTPSMFPAPSLTPTAPVAVPAVPAVVPTPTPGLSPDLAARLADVQANPEMTCDPLVAGEPDPAQAAPAPAVARPAAPAAKTPAPAGKAPTGKPPAVKAPAGKTQPQGVQAPTGGMDLIQRAEDLWSKLGKVPTQKKEMTFEPLDVSEPTPVKEKAPPTRWYDEIPKPNYGLTQGQKSKVSKTIARLTDVNDKDFIVPGSPEDEATLEELWVRKDRAGAVPVVSSRRKRLMEWAVALAKDPTNPDIRRGLKDTNAELRRVRLGFPDAGLRELVLRAAPPDSQLARKKADLASLKAVRESDAERRIAWDRVYAAADGAGRDTILRQFPNLKQRFEKTRTFRGLLETPQVELLVGKGLIPPGQLPLEQRRALLNDSLNAALGF